MRLVKCPFSISYIKRSDTPHYENVPFEIPSSWVWTTVNAIAKSILYGVSESAKTCGKYKLLRITDIQNNNVQWDTVPYTDFDTNKAESYLLNDGDILFARTGATVGKSYLVQGLKEEAIYASYLIRVQTYDAVLPQYVKFYFESGYYWEQIVQESVGVGQPNVNGTILGNLNIPIPPIHEQDRIVSELSKWMGIIDVIEQGKIDLQTVIKEAKSKILDLAIHGKLVPQDPNDEPASELLKRINPAAEITCDNGHYPLGWCKTQLKYIADYVNGRAFKPEEWETNGIPIVRIQNLNDEAAPYNKSSKSYEEKYLIHEGDLLFAWAASLGTYIWEKGDAWLNQHIFKVIPFVFMDKLYLYYSLESLIKDFYKESHGSGMVHITKKKFEDIECFVPPLSEQQRIVAKIEELFSILDKIKKALEA